MVELCKLKSFGYVSYTLALATDACQPPRHEFNWLAAAAAKCPHPLEGTQSGQQTGDLCALGETGRTRLQVVSYLQDPIFGAKIWHLLLSGKALKTFTVMSVPRD